MISIKAPAGALLLSMVVLAGCAGAAVEHRAPQCMMPDTLVCYGKTATKLEKRHRLEEVEFCRCERGFDLR